MAMDTNHDDARNTLEFAIRDGLISNWPIKDAEAATKAVLESVLAPEMRWIFGVLAAEDTPQV